VDPCIAAAALRIRVDRAPRLTGVRDEWERFDRPRRVP
jgi:hypothetical protein